MTAHQCISVHPRGGNNGQTSRGSISSRLLNYSSGADAIFPWVHISFASFSFRPTMSAELHREAGFCYTSRKIQSYHQRILVMKLLVDYWTQFPLKFYKYNVFLGLGTFNVRFKFIHLHENWTLISFGVFVGLTKKFEKPWWAFCFLIFYALNNESVITKSSFNYQCQPIYWVCIFKSHQLPFSYFIVLTLNNQTKFVLFYIETSYRFNPYNNLYNLPSERSNPATGITLQWISFSENRAP